VSLLAKVTPAMQVLERQHGLLERPRFDLPTASRSTAV
jgi:hypothetical protein